MKQELHFWSETKLFCSRIVPFASLVAAFFWGTSSIVFAQESSSEGNPGARSGISYGFSLAPFYQSSANIDGGGDFSLGSLFSRFKVGASVSERTTVGLSLKYDVDDYDFSEDTAFAGMAPWNDARRVGIGVPIFVRLPNSWSFSLSPAVNWLNEQGADSSESISYGATTFALKSYSRDKSIGLGAGVFRDIDDDSRVFPFIAVDWRFNEQWRLSNPCDADVLGPAGLELSYSFNDRWQLGGGSVYRSFRFRLDGEGVAPDGIGENEGWVGFLRLRRAGQLGVDFDIYAGATFNGKLELSNQIGEEISSSGYETAPFIALSLSGRF
jgi:hypothetical protein